MNPTLLGKRWLSLPHNHGIKDNRSIQKQVHSTMKKFVNFIGQKLQFCQFWNGKNTETLQSSAHETWPILLQFKYTNNGINAVFAPACTSQEFTLKSWFYSLKGHGNAKIAENLSNFGIFLILVVKYKFRVKTLLI